MTAVGFFEPKYNNDPILLQYAYRVLEEHDVSVTFFFVPQIVQALRHDSHGASLNSWTGPYLLIRIYRLCTTIHLRHSEGVAIVLSPNHMEHEGKLL